MDLSVKNKLTVRCDSFHFQIERFSDSHDQATEELQLLREALGS